MRDQHADTERMTPCPRCGHEDDDHNRESWYDEEGIEGMTCAVCRDTGVECRWWTWDWDEVVRGEAQHEGPDEYPCPLCSKRDGIKVMTPHDHDDEPYAGEQFDGLAERDASPRHVTGEPPAEPVVEGDRLTIEAGPDHLTHGPSMPAAGSAAQPDGEVLQ